MRDETMTKETRPLSMCISPILDENILNHLDLHPKEPIHTKGHRL